MTSPLTFSLPLINIFCAFASPLTSFAKSASLSDRVTIRPCQYFDFISCPRWFVYIYIYIYILTIRLFAIGSSALAGLARLLQINVPALLCAAAVLDCKGKDGATLFDGILSFGVAGKSRVDGVKSDRGGEVCCVCFRCRVRCLKLRKRACRCRGEKPYSL
jgi:hypothetical protein